MEWAFYCSPSPCHTWFYSHSPLCHLFSLKRLFNLFISSSSRIPSKSLIVHTTFLPFKFYLPFFYGETQISRSISEGSTPCIHTIIMLSVLFCYCLHNFQHLMSCLDNYWMTFFNPTTYHSPTILSDQNTALHKEYLSSFYQCA